MSKLSEKLDKGANAPTQISMPSPATQIIGKSELIKMMLDAN